jgi:hypothetical protein
MAESYRLRIAAFTIASAMLACNALSAVEPPPAKTPSAAKTVTAPPAPPPQPIEVKIASMPATAPAEVKVVSVPPDESAGSLVLATWGLFGVTALLVWATLAGIRRQSADAKRRDEAAMLREVNRSAHKMGAEAKRLEQLAEEIPTARSQLFALAGRRVGAEPEVEAQLKDRCDRLRRMQEYAATIAVKIAQPGRLPASELTDALLQLEAYDAQLHVMRQDITDELGKYESKSREFGERHTVMEAAKLSRPPDFHR